MVHPRQFPFYPEHVPKELKAGRAWVCCDAQKVPLIPWECTRASSTDPDTWRPYDDAVAAFRAHPERYVGVGRVISDEDPFVGVDLDDVRDPISRELSPEASSILAYLDSYGEISPSQKGVKVWVRGRLDRSYVRAGLEVYQRGRYFTITGQFFPQFPKTVEQRTTEINALVDREFPHHRRGPGRDGRPYDGPEVAIVEHLDGVTVIGEVADGLGTKFRIRCPWVNEHGGGDESGTYIGQRADGGLWFQCWHAHCASRGWVEFRRAVRLKAKKLRLVRKGIYV